MGIVYCLLFTNILVYWSSLSMSILGNLLKFVKAKLQRKENGKSKTMVRLFLIFWIHSNIFRNFSGCRRPIFKCFDIIRFVFPLAFQRNIRN